MTKPAKVAANSYDIGQGEKPRNLFCFLVTQNFIPYYNKLQGV